MLPKRWDLIAFWFLWYCRNYVAKNFHALRISKTGLPADPGEGPLVFLLNHPSWWDPITGILLSKIFTTRVPYCPIDSRGLGKYKFFSWLGFYSVEMGTTKGAIGFFKTTSYILNQPGTMVWQAMVRCSELSSLPTEARISNPCISLEALPIQGPGCPWCLCLDGLLRIPSTKMVSPRLMAKNMETNQPWRIVIHERYCYKRKATGCAS